MAKQKATTNTEKPWLYQDEKGFTTIDPTDQVEVKALKHDKMQHPEGTIFKCHPEVGADFVERGMAEYTDGGKIIRRIANPGSTKLGQIGRA